MGIRSKDRPNDISTVTHEVGGRAKENRAPDPFSRIPD